MLAKRKMTSAELAEKIGISAVNLSILKTGKAKGVRFGISSAGAGRARVDAIVGRKLL